MTPTRVKIELKQGVVYLRITPALYGVAQSRGLDISGKNGDTLRTYIKIMYCAAINDWEIRQVDNPHLGEFPYKYEEFEDWAWEDQQRFLGMIDTVLRATTGKGVKDYTEDIKKKSRKK